jgi:23S rRNA pseudouridine1911/1915/1917 synthase
MIYTATEEDKGKRLDAFLAEKTELSRSAAARLAESGAVTVCGIKREKKHPLKAGDVIELEIPEAEEYEAIPEDIPLDIVFEDDDIIVINKPSGMVVHPAPGNYTGTLVNALLYHCRDSLSGIGGVMRPGIVHRIDKDTSGLLVVAKNDFSHKALSEELGYHGIEREYHALVKGGFKTESGTVDLPIGRHPIDRKKMAVLKNDPSAREAITHYEVIESYGQLTYLRLKLETGRTHQIRVHMAHLGHALIGDEVYGNNKIPFEKQHASLLDGQILHAKRLTLTHPRSGERVTFECDLPDNFKRLIEILRKQ